MMGKPPTQYHCSTFRTLEYLGNSVQLTRVNPIKTVQILGQMYSYDDGAKMVWIPRRVAHLGSLDPF